MTRYRLISVILLAVLSSGFQSAIASEQDQKPEGSELLVKSENKSTFKGLLYRVWLEPPRYW